MSDDSYKCFLPKFYALHISCGGFHGQSASLRTGILENTSLINIRGANFEHGLVWKEQNWSVAELHYKVSATSKVYLSHSGGLGKIPI